MSSLRLSCLVFLFAASCAKAAPQRIDVAEFGKDFAYTAFKTKDRLGRSIRFYLTDADAKDDRPLILVLQGSGCASNFFMRDGRVNQAWHARVRQIAKGRAQILVVDKPGVKLFDDPADPGTALHCSPEFKREQHVDRLIAALTAALDGVAELRGTAPKHQLVMGHSEGGSMAPRVAAAYPAVSHVAALSAGPMSQLHDFFDMAASGSGFIAKAPGSQAEHIGLVLDAWKKVNADPTNETNEVFGHAAPYWAGKFAPFDFNTLKASKAKFFLAHGDADDNSSIRTFDSFAIELIVRQRDVTWLRVAGADHSFTKQGQAHGAGMAPMFERVVGWFFGAPPDRQDLIWPPTK